MYTYQYPRPAVAVDIMIFQEQEDEPHVLLIQRGQPPYQGQFALPGGFVEIDESLEEAAYRELEEETGLSGVRLEQLHAFGAPDRDPRGRIISVSYVGVIPPGQSLTLQAQSDAAHLAWSPLAQLPRLAFDHEKMIKLAAQERNLPLSGKESDR
jgi:8-oxo-dGTP diphosphatase